MEFIVRMLTRLGLVNGKSLDKAIAMMTKLDAYLEEVETAENEKAKKAADTAARAEADRVAAEERAARAHRIRERAQDFVA